MRITDAAARAYEFACHAASCAPPPAGTGGSRGAGGISRGKTVGRTSALKPWMVDAGGTGKAAGKVYKVRGSRTTRTTLPKHSTPEFIDVGKATYNGKHRHLRSAGETGHTASWLKKRAKAGPASQQSQYQGMKAREKYQQQLAIANKHRARDGRPPLQY